MTATLVVSCQEGEQVYNYKDVNELGDQLREVFQRSSNVTDLMIVVTGEKEISDMNIHVGVNH